MGALRLTPEPCPPPPPPVPHCLVSGLLTGLCAMRPKLVLQQNHTLHVQLDMADLMAQGEGRVRCMAVQAR